MSETPFQKFISLIEFDRNVIELKKKLAQAEKEFNELHKKEAELKDQTDQAKGQWQEIRKVVDVKELEMKELDQQELEKKERLDAVKNQKEYKSVHAELDIIKQKQVALEDEIVKAWNDLENAEKIYTGKKEALDKEVVAIRSQIEAKNSSIEKIKKDIDDHYSQRDQRQQGVPAEWLEKYAMMRERVTDPAVPAQEGNCSACFYIISPQDMQRLNKNALLECKGCYRFLFINRR